MRLFSAYAEVFPSVPQRSGRDRSFLCLRRGVSRVQTDLWNLLYFSLPTQRCFCRRIQCRHCRGLFSAYAEVFPVEHNLEVAVRPFLCLRRGVSIDGYRVDYTIDFSLPTQRCFSSIVSAVDGTTLFSAYAEVFLVCAVCGVM